MPELEQRLSTPEALQNAEQPKHQETSSTPEVSGTTTQAGQKNATDKTLSKQVVTDKTKSATTAEKKQAPLSPKTKKTRQCRSSQQRGT
nr:hypothetical protein [Haliscomenobacter sp.]